LCLFNCVQARQFVDIKGYVFQGERPSFKNLTTDDYDYARIRQTCQPQ
jgi:hypothetical protein